MACHHLPSVRCTECAYGYGQVYYPTVPGGYPTYQYTQTPHKCPVCEGKGTVPDGFYDDDDSNVFPINKNSCRACVGMGVIWR